MLDLICHSTFGTLLNALSGGRVLLFAEQRPDYVVVSLPPTQAPAKPRASVQRKGKTYDDAESTPIDCTQETAIVALDIEERGVKLLTHSWLIGNR